MSLSHRHQQLVCYQLSKSESLVKGIEKANVYFFKYYFIILHFNTYIYPGNPCKVNELEYSELLSEVCPLLNGESKIHRYVLYY